MISKIVSGGQTGVDRAALDIAIELEIDHGGWCPLGRRAEDGAIPGRYNLEETSRGDYAQRTEQNVFDSDGTLIFYRTDLQGGTKLTVQFARKHSKPLHLVDVESDSGFAAFDRWRAEHDIEILNVAGPRASNDPELYEWVSSILRNWLRPSV